VLEARNQFKQQMLTELLAGTMHNSFKWVDVMLCSKKDWGQLVSQVVKYNTKVEKSWWKRVKIAISSSAFHIGGTGQRPYSEPQPKKVQ